MATHSSIFAWKIPWTEEPGRATVHGVAKSQTQLSNFTFFLSFQTQREGTLGASVSYQPLFELPHTPVFPKLLLLPRWPAGANGKAERPRIASQGPRSQTQLSLSAQPPWAFSITK